MSSTDRINAVVSGNPSKTIELLMIKDIVLPGELISLIDKKVDDPLLASVAGKV